MDGVGEERFARSRFAKQDHRHFRPGRELRQLQATGHGLIACRDVFDL
jgi:hypothetical protein